MLVARSAPECRLYIDLHPCHCGEHRLQVEHSLRADPGGALVADYWGTCPRCGAGRTFVFELDEEIPPPPPAYGGDRPSRILCPGQFMRYSTRLAGAVRADPRGVSAGERVRAAGMLELAVAAAVEVVKFIPPNGDAVPAQAFTSPEGLAEYQAEPGRFRRVRLEANLEVLRGVLRSYQG
ncbi:hypothetical protein V5P93_003702 [Actinokineospora auranticolor]|uniref:Uncharacterized protein n=1 Tax=Actinokineospora auranticolor TaxID=155976 RepID=A0A2S6GJ55_9PSEU|nr:hypothetical protein [Actinokineospora auranticolor]PPK65264.1 hypothetical protein CLV40_115111 [Actinokineospora auranticolor]